MSSRKAYPLESVLQHREQRLEERTRDVAARNRELAEAERQRVRSEERRDAHAQEVRSVVEHAQQQLDEGRVRVDDLLTLQAWQIAQGEVARSHSRRVAEAAKCARSALEQQEQSRQQLARANADAEVTRRHRAAFEAEARKREQNAAEEDAAELFNARRRGEP